MGSVVVAYSGGVDSALVAAVAGWTLGERALAVTAVSPAVPEEEVAQASHLAAALGLRHRVLATAEVDDPRYRANDPRRCYFCKSTLYARLHELARELGLAWVADGTNVDDLSDDRGRRPGSWGCAAPWWRRGSPRPRCGRRRGRWGCPCGTSPPSPAWRRASPTAPR